MALLRIFWSVVSSLICGTVIFKNWHPVLISLDSEDTAVKGERLSFSAYRSDNWSLGEWIGQKIGPLFPVWWHLAPCFKGTQVLAGLVYLEFLSDTGLYFWHTDTFRQGRLCHPQQFFAWINCPQSESLNGCDIVFRLEGLRPHPSRRNPF